jgi:hypothetical protein
MAIRSAYIHLYQKNYRRIFHGTMKETDVEGLALYHH